MRKWITILLTLSLLLTLAACGKKEEAPPEEEPAAPAAGELEIPPCPWEVHFYPDTEYAGIVEIWLHEAGSLDNAPAEDYNEGQADS